MTPRRVPERAAPVPGGASMSIRRAFGLALCAAALLAACGGDEAAPPGEGGQSAAPAAPEPASIQPLVDQYATVRLTANLAGLPDADRLLVQRLIEAAEIMDDVFWEE